MTTVSFLRVYLLDPVAESGSPVRFSKPCYKTRPKAKAEINNIIVPLSDLCIKIKLMYHFPHKGTCYIIS
jgi:hypothetical protein